MLEAGKITALWRYARSRGLLRTGQRAVMRYVYARESWVLARGFLDGPPANLGTDGITFRPVGLADEVALRGFEPLYRASEFRARLDEGCWLDMAFDGKHPVAFRLVTRAVPPLFQRVVRLEPHEVWTANAFCLPAYRTRGVMTRLGAAMDRRLATLGYRETLSIRRLDNTAIMTLGARRGRQAVCRIDYCRLLWRERWRVSHNVDRLFTGGA